MYRLYEPSKPACIAVATHYQQQQQLLRASQGVTACVMHSNIASTHCICQMNGLGCSPGALLVPGCEMVSPSQFILCCWTCPSVPSCVQKASMMMTPSCPAVWQAFWKITMCVLLQPFVWAARVAINSISSTTVSTCWWMNTWVSLACSTSAACAAPHGRSYISCRLDVHSVATTNTTGLGRLCASSPASRACQAVPKRVTTSSLVACSLQTLPLMCAHAVACMHCSLSAPPGCPRHARSARPAATQLLLSPVP